MAQGWESAAKADVEVSLSGDVAGDAAGYARRKIGALRRLTDEPVLRTRVRLTKHSDPAVTKPVVAQVNMDVNGRLVRVQAQAATAQEAVDRLVPRLRRALGQAAERREAERREARGASMSNRGLDEWRHTSARTHRPEHIPRPFRERQIVRRKSYAMNPLTVDEAATEMDLLDYDFHLFIEKGSGVAGVLYRAGSSGYRLAHVVPIPPEQLRPFTVPVTFSAAKAPCLTFEEAKERLGLQNVPFLFFIEAMDGRASVLYHRYDGNYGLITPGG